MLTKIIVQINMKFEKEDKLERIKQKHVGETRVVMFLLYRPFILCASAERKRGSFSAQPRVVYLNFSIIIVNSVYSSKLSEFGEHQATSSFCCSS